MSYIVPFILGVFVGQEIQDVPRVKPYLEAAIKKVLSVGREIIATAQEGNGKKTDSPVPDKPRAPPNRFFEWMWGINNKSN